MAGRFLSATSAPKLVQPQHVLRHPGLGTSHSRHLRSTEEIRAEMNERLCSAYSLGPGLPETEGFCGVQKSIRSIPASRLLSLPSAQLGLKPFLEKEPPGTFRRGGLAVATLGIACRRCRCSLPGRA
jgi:hypothetical protein